MSKEILKVAKDFVKQYKTYPSMSDLMLLGLKRTTIRDNFGNLEGLHDAVYKECKDILFDLNREEIPALNTSKYKRYIITTAVTGDVVFAKALRSIQTYEKENKAKLIVHVSKGSKNLGQSLDPILRGAHICLGDLWLNNNAKLVSVFQSGARTDPTSGGIPRIGKRDSSVILASPKQRLVYNATGIDKLAHATMSTGAVTYPKYDISKATGYVADYDHVMGAIIVEVENDEIFHFRQVQFDSDGGFVDLGRYYIGSKVKKMAPSAMILGDWHAGKTDEAVEKASYKITKALGIKEWVLHDIYDADSTSHHDEGKLLLLTKKADQGRLGLQDELNILTSDVLEMCSVLERVTVVKSNHEEHLERYLDEGRFMKHPHNARLSIELAAAMLTGQNPIEYAVKTFSNNDKRLSKVRWLTRDESYQIAGIECGAHGDKGGNGSRGSITSMEKSYGPCVFGHAHTPQILRQAYCVGTSTATSADYGTGPSSWMNTHCLIYPNGQRQLINCIGGKFSLDI